MFKYVVYLSLAVSLFSCGEDAKPVVKKEIEKPEELVVIDNGLYTEYYPGKKHVKFQGQQDENKQRHGKWTYYSENGTEQSITYYDHGKKHGHTIVKYPNGNLHYIGEYDHDVEIGVWQMYDEAGVKTEKDYSNLK